MNIIKRIKAILVSVLALSLLFVSVCPAYAQGTNNINADSDVNTQYKNTMDQLNAYVEVVNNQFVLAIPSNVKKNVNKTMLNAFKKSMEQSNKVIRMNNLKIDPTTKEATLYISDNQLVPHINGSPQLSSLRTSNTGVTKVVFTSWGFKLYLSSSMVRYIAIGGVGAISAIIGLIPGVGWSIAAGIVGAVGGAVAGDHTFPPLIVYHYYNGLTFAIPQY